MFAFFNEIEQLKGLTADKILRNLAQIVLSTNEELEAFIELHNIKIKSLER